MCRPLEQQDSNTDEDMILALLLARLYYRNYTKPCQETEESFTPTQKD
jgi:hypothetical protein